MAPEENGSGGRSSSNKGNRSRGNYSTQRGRGSKPFRGGRGGRGGGDRGGKKRDMGRSEWSKTKPDKRSANTEAQASKRQKLNDGEAAALPVYATQFDAEDIAAEERRPKKKVAVMIGYSGTGYKGMQLAPDQKTIEGDLFKAFVAAGAISKANADDPKKSSFVRCARTDKGVHAAGNIISLKLIVEDENIVQKINDALTPQIRVWGFERTNNSFSSYQLCDSRIYEYLIPTHSFLPPHPKSYLGRKCREWAEKKGELEVWETRQEEVKGYWEAVDEEMIQPILDEYPEDIRDVLQKALWLTAEQEANKLGGDKTKAQKPTPKKQTKPRPTTQATVDETNDINPERRAYFSQAQIQPSPAADMGTAGDVEAVEAEEQLKSPTELKATAVVVDHASSANADSTEATQTNTSGDSHEIDKIARDDGQTEHEPLSNTERGATGQGAPTNGENMSVDPKPELTEEQLAAKEARKVRRKLIEDAVKRLRTAYISAKRKYRIPDARKQRLQDALNLYCGTNNHWNFTVQKTFRDPSAKRVIKTFKVNPTPILIDGTEWLSLKVHGQSFMMHQIRKLVGMAALIVRCGCDPGRIRDAYGPNNFSIPKAPALGLLLERPIFDSYNKRAESEFNKEPIEFVKYETEMDAFKQKFIYERMYVDEERDNVFGNFFNHLDNYPSNTFLFVTSGGLEACQATDGPETGAIQAEADADGDGDSDVEDAEPKVGVTDLDSDDEADGVRDNAGDEG